MMRCTRRELREGVCVGLLYEAFVRIHGYQDLLAPDISLVLSRSFLFPFQSFDPLPHLLPHRLDVLVGFTDSRTV